MITLKMLSKAPINANSLSSLNIGNSLPALSSGMLSTLNNRKNTAGSMASSVASTVTGTVANTVAAANARLNPDASTQTAAQSATRQSVKPAFTNPLKKGQKTTLDMSGTVLDIRLGLNTKNPECDVDVSAFLIGKNGKVLDDSWFVFYGQPNSPDSSTNFTVLQNETDHQKILIDTAKLNGEIDKVVFVLSINEAASKGLNFSMVSDAYLRILDPNGNEICSYEMEDYYDNVISMVIGEIYKHNDSFKFNPVGNGMAKDLAGLCELYGVSVS